MMTVTVQDGKLTFNSETGRWEDEDGNIGCMKMGRRRWKYRLYELQI